MKCLKCEEKEYCSKFCISHFIHYFERKFKKNLLKNKLIEKNVDISILGENKEVAKFLLFPIIKRYNVKINQKGKKLYSFSLNKEVVEKLSNLMKTTIKNNIEKKSVLSIFLDKEIKKYCILKKISNKKTKYSKFNEVLYVEMEKLNKRKTNLWQSSKIFLTKLLK